jgi:ribosomal-protein-alanine N-acetyltransferase
LEAAIDLDNHASIALARAAKLHDEGIKKHYWFQNNRWQDQRVFIAVPELFG